MSISRSLLVAAILTSACTDPDSEPAVANPELRDCSANWTVLHEEADDKASFAPQHLLWHDGNLYYQAGVEHIFLLPETGGTPEAITEGDCLELWVEGDRLLCARDDRLYAAPLSGGARSLLVDGEMFANQFGRGLLFGAYALDDAYLYWILWETLEDRRPASVWRLARDGGHSEKLGDIPDPQDLLDALVILPEQLWAVGNYGHAYTLPKDGGEMQVRPEVGHATRIAAASSGILWSVDVVTPGSKPARVVRLSRPTGARDEPFWPDKQPEITPARAWSDAPDEWVLYAGERFSDGQQHLSVWSVDAKGRAARIGCAPDDASSSSFVVVTGVLTDEAVFLSVQRRSGWAVVRLMRQ